MHKELQKRVICVPLAFKTGANSGANVRGDVLNVYLKNACVALCSAKHYNQGCTVCLATNISQEFLPKEYVDVLTDNQILICEVPYDSFCFPDTYKWSLAFYKLCVLKYLCCQDYEYLCYVDTDVYVQSNFSPVWEECRQSILLYDINHGLQVPNYRTMCAEVNAFCGTDRYITHYGGEFFAASTSNARVFCARAEQVYGRMMQEKYETSKGDEFIINVVANSSLDKVKNAGAYVHRFWTGDFHLVSTCYEFNRVVVLHLPAEKARGILSLYSKYISKGKIPSDNIVWKACRLRGHLLYDRIRHVAGKLLRMRLHCSSLNV